MSVVNFLVKIVKKFDFVIMSGGGDNPFHRFEDNNNIYNVNGIFGS
jgi:hypothetical protein